MSDPADLAKTMDSLHLDPEVAKKKIADLEERNALLEARDIKRGKDMKILKEMDYHQRDKIGELEGKLGTAEEKLKTAKETIESNEAELDAANCTTEEYRVEVDRLERHVDVNLLEKYEKLTARNEFLEANVDVNLLEENKKLTARVAVLEAQTGVHTKDVDVEMQDAFDPRPVCRHWAAGSCRHGEKCKYGRHSANTAEATTSTTSTHNTTRDLELQSAK